MTEEIKDKGCFFTFYTLTPLHAGAGASAGAIDLPVERERHTQYPCVYASGMKGALREYFRRRKLKTDDIFGMEGSEIAAGNVVFTDAKMLLFPTRSSAGVFKWVTCPFVIKRFYRDAAFIDRSFGKGNTAVAVTGYSGLACESYPGTLILEDFPIKVDFVDERVEPYKTILGDITVAMRECI